MKGVILAGGEGTRLRPLTAISNKHLLSIYNRPMIEYPLATLTKMGIDDILIVSGREHSGHFLNYLGSGVDRGLDFTYKVQEVAGGIAQALGLAKDFIGDSKFAMILGDNIFEDNFNGDWKFFLESSDTCTIFLKEVEHPERFGVYDPTLDAIVEKPLHPPTKMAVTGLYFYDSQAFEAIKDLKPSGRGELEITDLNNWYIKRPGFRANIVEGFWSDAGTFDSMMASSNWAQHYNYNGKKT